jgi:hypothetical protein
VEEKRGGDLPGEEGIYFINTTDLDADEDDGEDAEANHSGTTEEETTTRRDDPITSTKANY